MSVTHCVEKLCSLTLREFQLNLSPLTGASIATDVSSVTIPIGVGQVIISYEPRPGLRLSGLLTMPFASVTLLFHGVGTFEQDAFVKRFELAFQRGGG